MAVRFKYLNLQISILLSSTLKISENLLSLGGRRPHVRVWGWIFSLSVNILFKILFLLCWSCTLSWRSEIRTSVPAEWLCFGWIWAPYLHIQLWKTLFSRLSLGQGREIHKGCFSCPFLLPWLFNLSLWWLFRNLPGLSHLGMIFNLWIRLVRTF